MASTVLGSVVIPKLKWAAAAIGAGLTYAAVSDTCAMANVPAKLPLQPRRRRAGNKFLLSLDILRTPPSRYQYRGDHHAA